MTNYACPLAIQAAFNAMIADGAQSGEVDPAELAARIMVEEQTTEARELGCTPDEISAARSLWLEEAREATRWRQRTPTRRPAPVKRGTQGAPRRQRPRYAAAKAKASGGNGSIPSDPLSRRVIESFHFHLANPPRRSGSVESAVDSFVERAISAFGRDLPDAERILTEFVAYYSRLQPAARMNLWHEIVQAISEDHREIDLHQFNEIMMDVVDYFCPEQRVRSNHSVR